MSDFALDFEVKKRDEEQQIVFGWSYVTKKNGEQVVDHSGEIVSTEDIEKGAYDFVLESRIGDDMHDFGDAARLVESMVFTKEKCELMGLSLADDREGWWVGFKVSDAELWKAVKAGDRGMFSIGGKAVAQEV